MQITQADTQECISIKGAIAGYHISDSKKKRIYLGSSKEKEAAVSKRKTAEAMLHDPIIREHWNKLTESGKDKWRTYSFARMTEQNDDSGINTILNRRVIERLSCLWQQK